MSKYTLTLDASQLNQFGKCNLSWAYQYRECLSLSEIKTEPNALDKGTLVHLLLELFYKEIASGKDRVSAATQAQYLFRQNPMLEVFSNEYIQFIIARFNEYYIYWQGRDLIPAVKNGIPAVELGFTKVLYEDEYCLYAVEGKIDLIYMASEESLAICDHKSQDRENHLYFYRPQMLTYAWATGLNYAIINYFGLQKKATEKTFRRDAIAIPDWMIKRWEDQMMYIFNHIHQMDILAAGGDPKEWPNELKFQRNFSECSGSFDSNPCMYHHLCETESDEMRENIKKFQYHKIPKWEPWAIKK